MTLLPASEAEAADLVRAAAARATPLALRGRDSKAAIGRPVAADASLATHRLTGITLYEPAEMVIGARAGTPLADLVAALDARGQMLPFEPMDPRSLLGRQSGGDVGPTLGGTIAANLSGPRRVVAGALRDALLGLRFVNGRGELILSGGRVMKNVTGLDLARLHAGAWGTLGLITEATLRVIPKPETEATLVLHGLSTEAAVTAMAEALGSPYAVSGAAHLPAGIGEGDTARTLIRLENLAVSVAYRLDRLEALLRHHNADMTRLETGASQDFWRSMRDAAFLAEPRDAAIWRLSTAPLRGAEVAARLEASVPGARFFLDWGGGLIWLAVPADRSDAGAREVRAALAPAGGHAMLIRADDTVRARVDVFQPQADAVMALQRRVKASLDPSGLLNPGRMYPDF